MKAVLSTKNCKETLTTMSKSSYKNTCFIIYNQKIDERGDSKFQFVEELHVVINFHLFWRYYLDWNYTCNWSWSTSVQHLIPNNLSINGLKRKVETQILHPTTVQYLDGTSYQRPCNLESLIVYLTTCRIFLSLHWKSNFLGNPPSGPDLSRNHMTPTSNYCFSQTGIFLLVCTHTALLFPTLMLRLRDPRKRLEMTAAIKSIRLLPKLYGVLSYLIDDLKLLWGETWLRLDVWTPISD